VAESPSMGSPAQILTHAHFSHQPVMQTRKAGRRPKEIISLRRYAGDSRFAAYLADAKKKEMETLRAAITAANRAVHSMRYELAQLTRGQS
jgi:hypothetical protein